MSTEELTPTMVLVAGMVVLTIGERLMPAAAGRQWRSGWPGWPGWLGWLRIGWRNIGLGGVNALLLVVIGAPCMVLVSVWAEAHDLGLLRAVPLSEAMVAMVAVLMIDGLMYLWHRANHVICWLWHFHRLHHSDEEMDATTTIRFHPVEIAISILWRMAAMPLLGLTIGHYAIYEFCLFPVILLHHSNLRVPWVLERLGRRLIVTPGLHRVHHSRVRIESESNFASIFSFWDRLGGTLMLRERGWKISFGVEESEQPDWRVTSTRN